MKRHVSPTPAHSDSMSRQRWRVPAPRQPYRCSLAAIGPAKRTSHSSSDRYARKVPSRFLPSSKYANQCANSRMLRDGTSSRRRSVVATPVAIQRHA